MRHTLRVTHIILSSLVLGLFAPGVGAQDPQALRQAADPSELERLRTEAQDDVESGAHSATELAAAYLRVATTSAELGDADRAQRAFVTVLALEPSFRLASNMPDEVRSPYLEARGFWSRHAAALLVTAALEAQGDALLLTVTDPAGLSARVRLRARNASTADMVERVKPSSPTLRVPLAELAAGRSLEYSLTLLDEYGNRIWQVGNDERPQQLAWNPDPALAAAPSRAPTIAIVRVSEGPRDGVRRRPRSRVIVGGVALATASLSLASAALAHFRREQLAADWNGARCTGTGVTRGSVCADERAELSRMEHLAWGLYGVGGAALATGAILLLLGPPRDRRAPAQALRCAAGPSALSLGCSLTF